MLSPKAQQVIHDYFNLPFSGIPGVRVPYFNNARLKQRGQLRALVGKGTPAEIVEEAQIISWQRHAGIFDKSGACCLHNEHTGQPVTPNDLRKFLVDNFLGVECSGFVTQVLRAHFLETKHVDITKKIFITSPRHFLRWLIAKLRPIENIDVRVYANPKNSTQIIGSEAGYDYSKVEAGDVLINLEKTKPFRCNHIMLVTNVVSSVILNGAKRSEESLSPACALPAQTGGMAQAGLSQTSTGQRSFASAQDDKKNSGSKITIHYIHARFWTNEGRYGHGVTEGFIDIIAPGKNLLEQTWTEKNCTGEANETFSEARSARVVEIRRLKL